MSTSENKQQAPTLFSQLVKHYQLEDVVTPPKLIRWQYTEDSRPNLKQFLQDGIKHYLTAEGKGRQAMWCEAYEEIVDWMLDNEGKGLCLMGDCGRGKTLITTRVLPVFIRDTTKKVATICNARDLKQIQTKGIRFHGKIFIVDDIGTERESVEYGNRRDLVPELLDFVEKEQCIMVCSTNLDGEALMDLYKERTFQRLVSCCKIINLNGQSFRT